MTTPAPRHDRFAPAAALLLVLTLAAGAATVVLFLTGALGRDHSEVCAAEGTDQTGCVLDVAANHRHQDLVISLATASGAATTVLGVGAVVVALAGRRR
ncbi:hypothetical protein [Nocardioides sp. SYSU DS0651]|uniref:hypothetical protein n=1 Tax=Nocardioides sp. SYSU DS0651 TaxID=3415955 RepID=UPI003F4C4777